MTLRGVNFGEKKRSEMVDVHGIEGKPDTVGLRTGTVQHYQWYVALRSDTPYNTQGKHHTLRRKENKKVSVGRARERTLGGERGWTSRPRWTNDTTSSADPAAVVVVRHALSYRLEAVCCFVSFLFWICLVFSRSLFTCLLVGDCYHVAKRARAMG